MYKFIFLRIIDLFVIHTIYYLHSSIIINYHQKILKYKQVLPMLIFYVQWQDKKYVITLFIYMIRFDKCICINI